MPLWLWNLDKGRDNSFSQVNGILTLHWLQSSLCMLSIHSSNVYPKASTFLPPKRHTSLPKDCHHWQLSQHCSNSKPIVNFLHINPPLHLSLITFTSLFISLNLVLWLNISPNGEQHKNSQVGSAWNILGTLSENTCCRIKGLYAPLIATYDSIYETS